MSRSITVVRARIWESRRGLRLSWHWWLLNFLERLLHNCGTATGRKYGSTSPHLQTFNAQLRVDVFDLIIYIQVSVQHLIICWSKLEQRLLLPSNLSQSSFWIWIHLDVASCPTWRIWTSSKAESGLSFAGTTVLLVIVVGDLWWLLGEGTVRREKRARVNILSTNTLWPTLKISLHPLLLTAKSGMFPSLLYWLSIDHLLHCKARIQSLCWARVFAILVRGLRSSISVLGSLFQWFLQLSKELWCPVKNEVALRVRDGWLARLGWLEAWEWVGGLSGRWERSRRLLEVWELLLHVERGDGMSGKVLLQIASLVLSRICSQCQLFFGAVEARFEFL